MPWQYGLAFAVPCLGGLLGARLSRRLVARFGRHQVMRTAGTVRACLPVGLAFIGPGVAGLVARTLLPRRDHPVPRGQEPVTAGQTVP